MRIEIYVQPGAKKSGYVGLHGGRPKIKVAAPPIDGAANDEVRRFIATALNLKQSAVTITAGLSSRLKTVEINYSAGLDEILLLLGK